MHTCIKWALSAIVLAAVAAGPAYGTPTTVVVLDRGEAFEGMVFHDGFLFVGQSRQNFNANYRVDIFDRQQKLVRTVKLNHSAVFLYKYSAHAVMVVGLDGRNTQYTVITHSGSGRFETRTQQIPETAWAYTWLGTKNGREYFTDFSGNTDDPERNDNFNLPSQTFFTVNNLGHAKYLQIRLPMPGKGIAWGNSFLVVHHYQLGNGSSNIARLDLANNQAVNIFPANRNNIRDLVPLNDGTHIAIAEAGTGNVVIANGNSGQLAGTATLGGYAFTLATLGHCVVAGNRDERKIKVFDVADVTSPKELLALDTNLSTNEFRGLAKIAVDEQTGHLYARSSEACNPITQACDADWNRVIKFEQNLRDSCSL